MPVKNERRSHDRRSGQDRCSGQERRLSEVQWKLELLQLLGHTQPSEDTGAAEGTKETEMQAMPLMDRRFFERRLLSEQLRDLGEKEDLRQEGRRQQERRSGEDRRRYVT